MIAKPDKTTTIERIISRINSDTDLNVSATNSTLGRIVSIFVEEVEGLWSFLQEIEANSDLFQATGTYLDRWGDYLGVSRKRTTKSTTVGLSRAVKFTNLDSGTVTIIAGTRVYSSGNPSVSFFTTENLSLDVAQSDFVHVIAADTGSYYSAKVGDIDSHNSVNISVSVTNTLPIDNGSDEEGDDSYRFRLLQEFQRRFVLNEENFRSMFMAIPGVKNVSVYRARRGPGTVDVVLFPSAFQDKNTILSLASTMAAEAVPVWTDYKLLIPERIPVNVEIFLTLSSGTSSDLSQRVTNAVNNYISSLDSSNPAVLYPNQITRFVIDSAQEIKNAAVIVKIGGSILSNNGFYAGKVDEKFELSSITIS